MKVLRNKRYMKGAGCHLAGGVFAACVLSALWCCGCGKAGEGDLPQQETMQQMDAAADQKQTSGDRTEAADDAMAAAGAAGSQNASQRSEEQERPLSAQELEAFTEYLNRWDNYGFLLSEYESPEYVDLDQVFYSGAGMQQKELTQEECAIYEAQMGEIYTDTVCLTGSQIDEFLQRKAGITLADMKKELGWFYLETSDCYVCQCGDTNYTSFTCADGTETGEGIFCLYCVCDYEYGQSCVITLQKWEDGYRVLSNRYADESESVQVRQQETNALEGTAADAAQKAGIDQEIYAQLEAYASCAEEWLALDWEPQTGCFAVEDLDDDGRLELIVWTMSGTGLYSDNYFYQLDEAGTGIIPLGWEIEGAGMQWDMGSYHEEPYVLRDGTDGRKYYMESDYTKNGYAETFRQDGYFCVVDGIVYDGVLRGCMSIADEDTDELEETYYDGSGLEISKEDWEALYEDFVSDRENAGEGLKWSDMTYMEAKTASEEELLQLLVELVK